MKARRVDVQRALLHWQKLYEEPPPKKKRPADLETGGPETHTHTGNCKTQDTLTPEDQQREAQARASLIRYCLCAEPDAKRRHLERMNHLILGRSPAMIHVLEKNRGLL